MSDVNDTFECTKPHGKYGELCNKYCVRFNNGTFIVCKFFELKDTHAIFKM